MEVTETLGSHPNFPVHTVLLGASSLPCSPWERAPSRALRPRLCAKCCLAVEHYLEFTRILRGQRGQFLSRRRGGCSRCLGRGWGGWLGYWSLSEAAFGKSQILVEGNCSTDTFVNVLIVTDSQHGRELVGGGSLAAGGGSKGHLRLLFLFGFPSLCLISLCLSLAELAC